MLNEYEKLVNKVTEDLCESDCIDYQTVFMSPIGKALVQEVAREAHDNHINNKTAVNILKELIGESDEK